MKHSKLFRVEMAPEDSNFGSGWSSFSSSSKVHFILANEYEQALQKLESYLANNIPEKESVIGYDGSLNIASDKLIIKSISIVAVDIIC